MNHFPKKIAYITATVLVTATTLFVLFLIHELKNQRKALFERMIHQEAHSHYENMVTFRSWNARHGGVFVKPAHGEQPNPYLPDNHIYTDQGEMLLRVNPAWMTRQLSEISNAKHNYYFKITSLHPINPKNAPDEFESEALRYFEKHPDQKEYFHLNDDFSKFNYMGALKMESSCMQCHARQGYHVGDIRGGIRVSIPLDTYALNMIRLNKLSGFVELLVIFFGLSILWLSLSLISRIYRRREELENLNSLLEKRVQERTHELEHVYAQEKYLKNLIKMIAEINELLISSFSAENIIKNAIDKLLTQKNYNHVWVGIIRNDYLESIYASYTNSTDSSEILYKISDLQNQHPFIAVASESLPINKVIIKKIEMCKETDEEKTPTHWIISLPLRGGRHEKAIGVMNICTTLPEGFGDEESEMLKNLATDIGIALHSLQQRTMLEEMELEKIANYEKTVLAFVTIIEQRDSYTAGHTLRVAEYSRLIASEMQFEEDAIKRLEKAAILHDIGKVATPDAILLKPGRLTPLEYELIKHHSESGFQMLSKIDMYKDIAEIIRYHHVRYDGKGYPITASPDDVPMEAHILALADAFDAMTSNRVYKPRKNIQDALIELEEMSGTQFHPEVVKAALIGLKNIILQTSRQMPTNNLEEKRFSYFFQDPLTELYNENYLQIILDNEERSYNWLVFIKLHNFSELNKNSSWNKGNLLLKEIAKQLKEKFPEASIHRYQGDDFILLFKTQPLYPFPEINEWDVLKQSPVFAEISVSFLDPRGYSLYEIERLD